jgi:uncharacterized repeat protein (TIGR03943 family)
VNGRFAALLTVVIGLLTLRLTLGGEYLNYVRAGMYPWLLIAGLFLIVLGVANWLKARMAMARRDRHDGSSSEHPHGLSRAAWLLVLPVLAATLAQPAPLGSFAASRQTVRPPRPSGGAEAISQELASLQEAPAAARATDLAGLTIPTADNGSSEMSLLDFLEITYYDETKTLAGVPVTLVGFVVPAANGGAGEFLLSRFMISCCAADAQLLQAGVVQPGSAPKQDSWVRVTGAWEPDESGRALSPDGFPIPKLVASQVVPVSQPDNPYLTLQ